MFVNFNGNLVLDFCWFSHFVLTLTKNNLPDASCRVPLAPTLARVRVARVGGGVRGRLLGLGLDNLLDDAELDGGQRLGVRPNRVGGDGFIFRGAGVERGHRGARVVDLRKVLEFLR